MKKITVLNVFLFLFLFIFSPWILAKRSETSPLPVITIGIVSDGSIGKALIEQSDILGIFIHELKALTEGEFHLRFPTSKQVNGQWSHKTITQGLQTLQIDPEVDMVLALGWISSQIAATSIELRKPTFAPFIANTHVLGIKPENNTSGTKNLNYLSTEMRFEEDLQVFLNVVPFTQLAFLIDEANYQFFADHLKRLKKEAQQEGVDITFIRNKSTDDDLLADIPQNTQAVMLTLLPKLDSKAKTKLVVGLIARQLPSFNWMGNVSVNDGVLLSTRPISDWQLLARRNAFNMQAVMRGQQASQQPVFIEKSPQLTINMAAARAINISPPFKVLEKANLLYENIEASFEIMDLSSVAKAAVQTNLSIVAGKIGLEASAKNISEARSILFPNVTANLSYFQANADNPFVEIGFSPEKRSQGNVRLEQALFSERALAYLATQKHLQVAKKEQQRNLELDIVQQATTTFLSILIAQSQYDIFQNNLKLTQAHLQLAKNRVQAGTANMADVYRWESEIARVNQQVLTARSRQEQAKDTLNLILHRPIQQRYNFRPAALDDPNLLISHQGLLSIVTNKKDLELMSQFFVQEGLRSSPALATLEAQIKAQARQLDSDKRSYWLPDIGLFGEVAEVYDETIHRSMLGFNISLEDQTTWQAGVNLSMPLFEGGARRARVARSKLGLAQLNTQQQLVHNQIEQAIRSRLHALHASYPTIRLSRKAAEAAYKSYNIVKDNYINGTVSVTDLLDAQTASLVAQQAAANAVYAFLIDLMNLQRSIGQFDFFLNDPQGEQMANRLKQFIISGGNSIN